MSDDFSYSPEDRELFLDFLKTGTIWGIHYGMPKTEVIEKLGQPERHYPTDWFGNSEISDFTEIFVWEYGAFELYFSADWKMTGIGVDPINSDLLGLDNAKIHSPEEILEWFRNHNLIKDIQDSGEGPKVLRLISGVNVHYSGQASDDDGHIGMYAEQVFPQVYESDS